MAEIKSTLDLVMEKTKHLSLSSKEKETQETIEAEKKINGLLQQVADGTLVLDELYGQLDEFKITLKDNLKALLLKTIARRVALDGDNRDLLIVLATYCNLEITPIERILVEYQTTRQQEAAARRTAVTQALAERYHISGSAVVPNLSSDPGWLDRLASIQHDYQQRLDQIFTRLKPTPAE